MLKRLLLLLAETKASVVAREYAIDLAWHADAGVTGVAGLDLSFIGGMPGGIGSAALRTEMEHELEKQGDAARARLHDVFRHECEAHDVPPEWLSFEGDSIKNLDFAAETCDLIVTGHDTSFRGNVREQLSETLNTLLSRTPRPMVICGDVPPVGHDILVAYDGSLPAMRVLQIFVLLGFAPRQRIHLISVDADQCLASQRVAGVIRYLQSHGYDVDTVPIATMVAPADVIRNEVDARKAGTLVMGAYGHRGLREHIFGSTTQDLVEDPPCALFVYH
jgi:nucleotide-binding universal stress UspA family protein